MAVRILPAALAVCLIVLTQTVAAQEPVRYRQFELGSDLAAVAKQIGTATTAARIIHVRPADMKELEWRPRTYSSSGTGTDPVDAVLFRFYADRLFRVTVDYDRRRTEGMSVADLVEGITAIYGPTSAVPSRQIGTPTLQYGFPDTALAVWGNAEYSVTLLRVAYPAAFRLVVASTAVEELARMASIEAERLDAAEAPQRERERQTRDAAARAVAQEKTKTENKAQFKP